MPYKRKFDQVAYRRKWYAKNRKKYIAGVALQKKKSYEWFMEFKKDLSCMICGENHPACLQFHHRDPEAKEINVSLAVRSCWSKERILKEIEKCDVLCANCHFKHHYNESMGTSATDSHSRYERDLVLVQIQ